jgi:primosomal protein N' (replication factor Y)
VLIQTYRPEEIAVATARDHDYGAFYRHELEVRSELGYPPCGYLVALRVDGRSQPEVEGTARELARRARQLDRGQLTVLGPTEAPLAKLAGRVRWHLWVGAESRRDLRPVISQLAPKGQLREGSVRVVVDVDPISAL